MPKLIDPVERQRHVTDATFAVIGRAGLPAATLSNIADEAGLAIGSVRHYFTSRDELVAFAADALVSQIGDRLEQRAAVIFSSTAPADRFSATVELLLEILPLDEIRMLESRVWLEFAVAARTDPRLEHSADRLHDGLGRLVRRIIDSGINGGRLSADADPALEAERLHAFLDGLAMHGVLARPDNYVASARALVSAQLRSLLLAVLPTEVVCSVA